MVAAIIAVGLVGILAGGIVNALADDLPYYQRPQLPHFPDGLRRPVSTWLGIFAFILGKRAYGEDGQLSWRYPLTELFTALGMILVIVVYDGDPEVSGLQKGFWLLYIAILVLVTVIDMEHRLILFSVMIPSGVLGLLDALVTPERFSPDLPNALIGGAVGFGIFYLAYIGGKLYTRLRGLNVVAFGYGDVMLITFSGLILGIDDLFLTLFITVSVGAVGSILWMLPRALAGRRGILGTALPYGPYIVIATLTMLLFGDPVTSFLT